jgi:transcriptional regulator with XRE-family HTH domain
LRRAISSATVSVMQTLGKNIARERKRRGLTQMDVAVAASLSVNAISRLETGRVTDPGLCTLTKIAKAVGCSVAKLTKEAP